MSIKYGALLICEDYALLQSQLMALPTQKHPPTTYYIVLNNQPPTSFMNDIIPFFDKHRLIWYCKYPINNETIDYLIFEFFKTGRISEKWIIKFGDNHIWPDFSSKLFNITKNHPNYWVYKFDRHILFNKTLTHYFYLHEIEHGLCELGLSNKIYSCE